MTRAKRMCIGIIDMQLDPAQMSRKLGSREDVMPKSHDQSAWKGWARTHPNIGRHSAFEAPGMFRQTPQDLPMGGGGGGRPCIFALLSRPGTMIVYLT